MGELVGHKLSAEEQAFIDAEDFDQFLNRIIHDWLKTLSFLAISLVPLFFILDYFIVPKNLLPQVGIYRLIATLIVIVQYLIIRLTQPSNLSYLHGYIISNVVKRYTGICVYSCFVSLRDCRIVGQYVRKRKRIDQCWLYLL